MNSPASVFFNQNAPVLLDGGMATELETRGAVLDHGLWSARLLVDDPALIRAVHADYLDAGARVISTATYQLNHRDMNALGADDSLFQLAVDLIEEAIESRAEVARTDVLIAGSLGPYGASFGDGSEYTGDYRGAEHSDLESWHLPRARAFLETGTDVLAFETVPNLEEAAFIAAMMPELGTIPYWISFQLRDGSHLASGEELSEAIMAIKTSLGLCAVGVNCVKPDLVGKAVDVIKKETDLPILVYPNSGEAYRDGEWNGCEQTEGIVELAPTWLGSGVAAIGGCCRVGPTLIKKLNELLN